MEERQSEVSDHSAPEHLSISAILRSVLGTEEQNQRVRDVMIPLADTGFLDQHQTRNALDAVAKRLLHTLYGDDG